MKQFISVAFIVLLTHAGFTQNYLHLWINSDTLVVGRDRVLKIPVTITCKGVGCSLVYSGRWEDNLLYLREKSAPFSYTIREDCRTRLENKFLRNTIYFLQTGYSPKTRGHTFKIKPTFKKLKTKEINANDGECTVKIKLSRKEIRSIRCSSKSTVNLTYSLFLYKEELVYSEKNIDRKMILRKVKPCFDPVEVINGGYSSNSVFIIYSSTN